MSDVLKKIIITTLIVILGLIFLSFLKNIQNIDSFAYVVAIGLDKGTNNNLKLTFQTLSPASGSESSNNSSGNQNSSIINTSIECSTINSGIQLINGYIGSKQLNLSHCQSLIFSEELAYDGISEYIYTFMGNSQISHSTNILVSKCSAEYYLKNSESIYEKLVSKYYNISPKYSRYTGYTDDISLVNFFSSINNTFCEPTAILSSIHLSNNSVDNNNVHDFSTDSSFKAGESPISAENTGIEDIGLAVFKEGRLVGELTAIETIAYLMTNNKFQSCELTILNPFDENSSIDFSLSPQSNTKCTVDIVNGSPFINVDINLNAKILSMDKNEDYSNAYILTTFENAINEYLNTILYEYLYKTSIDYGSDISGFGKYALAKFLTVNDWYDYNWNENYKNSFFKVNVSTSINSSNLLLKT